VSEPAQRSNERYQSRVMGWSLLRLSELGKTIEYKSFSLDRHQQVSGEQLKNGVTLLKQVIDAYFRIAKSVIDSDPRDSKTLSSINGYVNDFLNYWTPEFEHPSLVEVEIYRERGDVDPRRLATLERQAAENEERAAAKREIDQWRGINRFGLLWWVERLLRTTGNADYTKLWEDLSRYFGDIESTAAIADAAMKEAREGHRWLGWVPTPDAPGTRIFSSPAVDREFLSTFVVLAFRLIDPAVGAPDLGRVPHITANAEQVEREVAEAGQNQAIASLLPDDELERRGELLIEAVQRSKRIEELAEEERIIRAELDPKAVLTVETAARQTWQRQRLLPPLFKMLNVYRGEEVDEDDGQGELRDPFRRWELKLWFVAESAVGGIETIGSERGAALAEGETSLLLDAAGVAPEYPRTNEESANDALRSAIETVRDRGESLVVLAPLNWRLPQVLDLEPAAGFGGNTTPPAWLSADLTSRFAGTADGVPVIRVRDPDLQRLLVFAADKFIRWTQWRPRGGEELHFSIKAYSEEEAREAVAEHADLFRVDENTTDEERVRELRKAVYIDVHENLNVEVVDDQAALWVPLKEDESE
jgi:hypothetical protein